MQSCQTEWKILTKHGILYPARAHCSFTLNNFPGKVFLTGEPGLGLFLKQSAMFILKIFIINKISRIKLFFSFFISFKFQTYVVSLANRFLLHCDHLKLFSLRLLDGAIM